MNKAALIYHSLHKLLFEATPRGALQRIGVIMFAAEQFCGLKLQPSLGFHPSEKYFAYSWIFENLPFSDGYILDVGCGDSLFPCELARRGYKTYTIDTSSSPWSFSVPFRHPKVNFVQADICNVPFQPLAFSMITAISTLEHIPEERAALAVKEMARILTDNGLVLVTMPLGENAIEMKRLLSQELDVSKEEYYISLKGDKWWSKVSGEEALNTDILRDISVVHLALAKKRRG